MLFRNKLNVSLLSTRALEMKEFYSVAFAVVKHWVVESGVNVRNQPFFADGNL